ncbi:MAG: 4,5-DOPA dioxygenase extradiol [Dysgonomonas sp.]
MTLNDLHRQVQSLNDTPPMPVLFVGHGTPMNAIENNQFAQSWHSIGQTLPHPQAILCISAHWETRGTYVTALEQPKTIHDFGGFPRELYAQQYDAQGSPLLAETVANTITDVSIGLDYQWGFDHGSWSVLKHIYPKADVPMVELSIDHFKDLQWHYDFAKELAFLRRKGVLIIGSGNMIHNLRILEVPDGDFNTSYGYDWAWELNSIFNQKIEEGDHRSLIKYESLMKETQLAVPTKEHYIPMLYALALQSKDDRLELFNNTVVAGALSMTSFIIQ